MVAVATMLVRFSTGVDPKNATCDKCGHPVSRHSVSGCDDSDGQVHCWECVGVGQVECTAAKVIVRDNQMLLFP